MKLNISFYLDKTDTLYQVYLSKCECTCGLLIIVEPANDKRNRIEWQFFFFLSLFFFFLFFPFSSPPLMRPREWSVYTVPRSRCLLLACITLASSERSFLLQRACSSFHGGSCFPRASSFFIHAWNYLWEVARVFSYSRHFFLFFSFKLSF